MAKLPLMKEIRKNFLRLSLERHPDKSGGSKEDFQELVNAYEKIGRVIQDTTQEDKTDDEETIARNLFKETNFEKINLYSVTVSILTTQADAWETVLIDMYGEPTEGKEKANGKKFIVKNVAKDEEKIPVMYVTLWKKEKSIRSTLLIDARRKQIVSIDFVQKVLPELFKKVIEICSSKPSVSALEEDQFKIKDKIKPVPKPRKRSKSTDSKPIDVCQKEWTCKDCMKRFNSTYDLN